MKKTPRTRNDMSPHIVLWTIVAASIAAAMGRWWLSPVVLTAPILVCVYAQWPRFDAPRLHGLTIRWLSTLFVTTLIASAFLPDQTPRSVLFGVDVNSGVALWLSGAQEPQWGVWWLMVVPLLFAGGALASGGILGWAMLTIVAGDAAVHAAAVYARGANLLQTTFIALTPWQWALLVGMALSATPLAELSLTRILRRGDVLATPNARRRLLLAGALFLLAVVLRLGLSGACTTLAKRWTVVA